VMGNRCPGNRCCKICYALQNDQLMHNLWHRACNGLCERAIGPVPAFEPKAGTL